MSGEAKTSKFLLANATIMVGPMANVFDLTPVDHSLGLTKQVTMNVDNKWTELTQGVTQTTVYTVNTGVDATLTGEIYEYTARNLAYAAGLDATGAAFDEDLATYTLASSHTHTSTAIALSTGGGTDFAAGDFVLLQQNLGDTVAVFKVASKSTDTLTPTSGYNFPANITFAVSTTTVYRIAAAAVVKVGAQTDTGLFGVKMVGTLPQNDRPIVAIFPKARIQKGLNLVFQEGNFSNMPFEIKPYALVPADAFYADFSGNKQALILPG